MSTTHRSHQTGNATASSAHTLTLNDARAALIPPHNDDNKYSRGVVGLITGSQNYPGAAVLTSKAAARTGVGMVRYIGPERAQQLVLTALPEAVMGKGRVDAWVVGSGVPNTDHGVDDQQKQAIALLLQQYALDTDADTSWREDVPPLVADAGALDLLPERVTSNVVLTPHVGELARLLTRRGTATTPDDVKANPFGAACLAADMTGAHVLLKGHTTFIVSPSTSNNKHSSRKSVAVTVGPHRLATAGSGDVLAGILGGTLATSYAHFRACDDSNLTERMVDLIGAGAFIHGFAGGIASGVTEIDNLPSDMVDGSKSENSTPVEPYPGRPIIASDIIDSMPWVIEEIFDHEPTPFGADGSVAR